MAEGVTYADLRFARSPPEKSRPPGEEAPEEASDGELTYENFAAARPRQPSSPGPDPQAPGVVRRRIWTAALCACLLLLLLVACIGLGVRYWQASRQLEGASQRHTAERSALEQRVGSREENLTRSLGQLSRARAELSSTRLALRQSWQAGNDTRKQLEEALEEAEGCLARLQQEKDQATRALEEARSCQQIGCCPPGWRLFRWRCLWVLLEQKTWEESKRLCKRKQAQLLVLKPWDAGTFWDAAGIRSRLRSQEFWIGLRWTNQWPQGWHWVDGTSYTGTEEFDSYYDDCVKLSQGTLKQDDCDTKLQGYICEKVATPSSWSVG